MKIMEISSKEKMDDKNTKLNHRVIVLVNKWTDDNLKKVSKKLSTHKSTLARCFINTSLVEILSKGVENVILKYERIEMDKSPIKKTT